MNETQSVDTAIEQVERLYRSVTGRDAPQLKEEPYATIPPEKAPAEHVQEQVDRLVETLSEFSVGARMEPEWKPQIGVGESQGELLILVDLPGVDREAVQLTVTRGIVEVHGTRPMKREARDSDFKLKYVEHPFGKFRRSIPLPIAAKADQLRAELRNGVLEIRVPKEAGSTEVKTVPVG